MADSDNWRAWFGPPTTNIVVPTRAGAWRDPNGYPPPLFAVLGRTWKSAATARWGVDAAFVLAPTAVVLVTTALATLGAQDAPPFWSMFIAFVVAVGIAFLAVCLVIALAYLVGGWALRFAILLNLVSVGCVVLLALEPDVTGASATVVAIFVLMCLVATWAIDAGAAWRLCRLHWFDLGRDERNRAPLRQRFCGWAIVLVGSIMALVAASYDWQTAERQFDRPPLLRALKLSWDQAGSAAIAIGVSVVAGGIVAVVQAAAAVERGVAPAPEAEHPVDVRALASDVRAIAGAGILRAMWRYPQRRAALDAIADRLEGARTHPRSSVTPTDED